MILHTVFDLLASALAFQAIRLTQGWRPPATEPAAFRPAYAATLVAGAVIGAYALGTLNLRLSGVPGIGRSILGALCGAIIAIEIYKRLTGITGSTGALFVPGFTVAVVVGRIGCFLTGLPDNTYGTRTTLPWGHDFGDGPRHPVQLYESALMALFLLYAITALKRRSPVYTANAFYLMAGFYAAERFGLEFLKPYAALIGPFNLFHLACATLFTYAVMMIQRTNDV
ncbi:MAG: prolipoprotein diacylglyceryl transferase family protein [bacterium]